MIPRTFKNSHAKCNIASALNRLIEKDVHFEWEKSCETAFPTLNLCRVMSCYILYTDTCDVEIEVVLAQGDVEGKVISYISKAFLGREKNYYRD